MNSSASVLPEPVSTCLSSLRNLALLCLAALALLLLAACDTSSRPADTLVIGNSSDPGTLDPHRAEGIPARNIQRDIYEGLVSESPSGEIQPGVAESWDVSDDGLTWTFKLRSDARWSNGDPVTAADFVESFQRALTPGTAGVVSETLLPIRNAGLLIAGESPGLLAVHAQGPHTLVIELESPTPYFLAILTHPSTFPVHRSLRESDQSAEVISNGAYRLRDWQVNQHVLLERNPHYHSADQVAIEKVRYLPISESSAELSRYRAGEIDITYSIPAGRMEWLEKNYPQQLHVSDWFGTYYLGLNVAHPALADVRVRRALSLAIDRKRLVESVTPGGESVAFTWVPDFEGYPSQMPAWAGWTQEKRNTAARRLMEDAGYVDQHPMSIEILYNNRDRDQRIMTAIAAMWAEVLPVSPELKAREWKVYLQMRQSRQQTEAFRSGWIGEYPDPHTFAEIFASTHGMNEFNWQSERYDELLAAAAREPGQDRRFELLSEAETIILEELPVIPLYHYAKARLVAPRVRGYTENPLDHHYSKHLSLDEAD